MNKKGFTLMELIISLTLIILISSASIYVIINKNNNKDDKLIARILSAANVYIESEKDEYGNTYINGIYEGGQGLVIPVSDLVNKGYLNEKDYKFLLTSNAKVIAGYFSEEDCKTGISLEASWLDDIQNTMYICSYSTKVDSNSCDDYDGKILKSLADKYSVIDAIPNFKLKSPKATDKSNYREYKKNITSGSDNSPIKLYYPIVENADGTFKDDSRSKGEKSGNVSAFFSSSYTFDEKTGKYSLTGDLEDGYMRTSLNKGLVYICDNKGKECSTMYQIKSWGSIYSSHSSGWSYLETISSAIEYTALKAIDVGDSGLYKSYDNDGATYYFRGAVKNNYVKLVKIDETGKKRESDLFQIVRFNGDSSIRLMSLDGIENVNNENELLPSLTDKDDDAKTRFISPMYENSVYFDTEDVKEYTIKTQKGSYYDVFDSVKIKEEKENAVFPNSTTSYRYSQFQDWIETSGGYKVDSICGNPNNDVTGKYIWAYTDKSGMYHSGYGTNNRELFRIISCENGKIKLSKAKVDRKIVSKDSPLKQRLEKWYEDELSNFDEFIINGQFCNDISINDLRKIYDDGSGWGSYEDIIYRADIRLNYIQTTVEPSYFCDKSSIIINKIGVITADELVFAGAISSKIFNYASDCNDIILYQTYKSNATEVETEYRFFLDRENSYITLTPKFYLNTKDNYNVVDKYSGNSQFFAFPVINIRNDLKIINGDEDGAGTKDNPYILSLP